MNENFVDAVRSWIKTDDLIREITLALREKKQERKKLEERILEFMKQTDQEVLSISSGGTLRRSVTKTKASLKQEYLREMLSKFTPNPDEAIQIILDSRPTSEREYLKRTQSRGKK